MNKLFDKYNRKEALLVISGWPKKKEIYSKGVCAVSSFTKNTISALQKENPGRKIVVLTMVINKKEIYEEDGVLVVRCFKRNTPLSYFGLLKQVHSFNKVKNVLIEFEFASFGDTITTGLLAPVVWIIALMGKNITLVCHQVISDIKDLSGHIGLSANNPLLSILNLSLKLFYKTITFPAKKVVVLEEEFKIRLGTLINSEKISVIPHGIDTNIKKNNVRNMRKSWGVKSNEFVILYFGYLTWYKGVDFLIDALKNVDYIGKKRIRLVVAGGPSFTQGEKVHYQNFLKKINHSLGGAKNVIHTDFVKEEDITPVFKSSDLVILPYRVFMSSSGPLSLTISHNKPFLLSDNLGRLTNSVDIKKSLQFVGLSNKDITFNLSKESLIKSIKVAMSPKTSRKMINLSKVLNEERSFASIAKTYDELLETGKANNLNVFYKLVSPNTN